MDTATALRGRVIAGPGFDISNAIFLLADDSNIDIQLQVHAPGMDATEFAQLCATICDRLGSCLVGLNAEMILNVSYEDEVNDLRVVINNPDYMNSGAALTIVLAAARAIVLASTHAEYRRVIALKRWECAVMVDWDEPFQTTRHEYALTLPAAATGLDRDKCDQLSRRIEALCDNGIMASVSARGDTVEITLWSPRPGGFHPAAARAHVNRILFALDTVVRLQGINNIPAVQLSHPFSPFVDDGSEPPEHNYEY